MPHNELFLGGLNKETRRQDLEDVFSKYGRLTRSDIKYINGSFLLLLLFIYKVNSHETTYFSSFVRY